MSHTANNRASNKASRVGRMRDESFKATCNVIYFLCVGTVLLSAYEAQAVVHAAVIMPQCAQVVTNLLAFLLGSFGAIGVGSNPICEVFSNFYAAFFGTTGKAVATMGVAVLGLAALFGKVSWTTAALVVFGVGCVFGANSALTYIGSRPYNNISNDPYSAVLQTLCYTMTSEAGRAVAVACVLVLGLGALFGKVSWTQALMLMTGIGLVFGAYDIVTDFWNTDGLVWTFLAGTTINDPLGNPFEILISEMVTQLGIAIGTVLVMGMGFAAMVGKISWPRALMLIVGIGLMYGCADVVYIITGPLSLCSQISSDTFTQVVCGFMEELQGPMGKTLSMLAVSLAGVMAMLGKISWELGLLLCMGIATIFGANTIVGLFEANMIGISCNTPAPSPPSTGNAIADVLCYILRILYGPAGKALACIAVIMIGMGALLGKVSFGQAAVVACGIALCFGAPSVINIVTNNTANFATTGCTLPGSGVWQPGIPVALGIPLPC